MGTTERRRQTRIGRCTPSSMEGDRRNGGRLATRGRPGRFLVAGAASLFFLILLHRGALRRSEHGSGASARHDAQMALEGDVGVGPVGVSTPGAGSNAPVLRLIPQPVWSVRTHVSTRVFGVPAIEPQVVSGCAEI